MAPRRAAIRTAAVVLGLLPLAALRLSQESDIDRRSDIVLMAGERDRLRALAMGHVARDLDREEDPR